MTQLDDKLTILYILSQGKNKSQSVEELMNSIVKMKAYINFKQIQNVIDVLHELMDEKLIYIKEGKIWLSLKKSK